MAEKTKKNDLMKGCQPYEVDHRRGGMGSGKSRLGRAVGKTGLWGTSFGGDNLATKRVPERKTEGKDLF